MIQQIFRFANWSCEMVQYKQESLILDIALDKAVDTNKRRNIVADKKLNIITNKAVNNENRQNNSAKSLI